LPHNLFVVVVGGSAAIINAAHPLARAGGVQHGRDEGGLSRVPVPHHGYITDIRAFINFHEFAPSAGPLYRPRRNSRPRLSGRAAPFFRRGGSRLQCTRKGVSRMLPLDATVLIS